MANSETQAQHWQELIARLRRYPELSERIERLLEIVENADGDSLTADEVEERVVEEVRRIGHDALQGWAGRKAARLEGEYARRAGLERRGKKNSTGKRASARSQSVNNCGVASRASRCCVPSRRPHESVVAATVWACSGWSQTLPPTVRLSKPWRKSKSITVSKSVPGRCAQSPKDTPP